MPPAWLVVGRIRRAHGIRGEVVVSVVADDPDAVLAPGAKVAMGDRAGEPLGGARSAPPRLTVERVAPFQADWRVAFAEVTDRGAAEGWTGCTLLARAEELPPPGPGEVWRHELVGLRVFDPGGAPLGEVAEWYDAPQGLLLDVRDARGRVVTVPYSAAFVVRVDRLGRTLVLDPPTGLFGPEDAP